jgi:hypothetical protein
MIQRFARDESGMTMGLAMIMVLIIGVMGAGLLAFANANLNTVLEANRGQRAFEVADAGIEAARSQLISDCVGDNTCMVHYNDCNSQEDVNGQFTSNCQTPTAGELQWSRAKGGLTLNNLDGIGTTSDSATVMIDYTLVDQEDNYYKVTSTGTYGVSQRKIEAIFKPISGGGGTGGNVINPAYYTPSDIRIRGGIEIKGMSLFSEGNIIIEGMPPHTSCPEPNPPADCLKTDYEINNRQGDAGRLTTTNVGQASNTLSDWDTTSLPRPPLGNWNTVGRLDRRDREFEGVGFGATGLICGSITECNDPSDSIAEGYYGYDSTTGPINGLTGLTNPQPRGQVDPRTGVTGLTFVDKPPIPECDPAVEDCYAENDPNTITFPFERKTLGPDRLKGLAMETNTFYRGQTPDWNTLLGDRTNRVVFIDAENGTLTFPPGNAQRKGIVVVWCGTLNMTDVKFQGIIVMLNGQGDELRPDPDGAQSSSCDSPERGTFTATNTQLQAWFYAEGGSVTNPGIDLVGPGTELDFLPGGAWAFLDLLHDTAIPTSFAVEGWRELYQ